MIVLGEYSYYLLKWMYLSSKSSSASETESS